jgi:tellurite resistance protein TerC
VVQWYHWLAFCAAIASFLALDLGVFNRRAHQVSLREALAWTAVWMSVALSFAGLLWMWMGWHSAGTFLAGYLLEWSLSADNVFVFILLFTHFAVPAAYQHRVLFWGVLGAIVLRLTFILAGSALLERFEWVVYVFGALLLVTAVRFLREGERSRSPADTFVVRTVGRVVPTTADYHGSRLFAHRDAGRGWVATPLLAVLISIELVDVVFAVDSIPAILALTTDAFIVFTSNALAILGLRSLYFVMAGAVGRFRYLRPALAALLAFVGVKMLLSGVVHVPAAVSLAVIVGILGVGAVASVVLGSRGQGDRLLGS